MGDDPEAPNYDKEKKLVKSLFTGSRGPMLRKATGLDWAGDRLVNCLHDVFFIWRAQKCQKCIWLFARVHLQLC
jgi:hypothetical protein